MPSLAFFMRLFTAIDLPETVREAATGLISKLRPSAQVRWSPAGNLHITTKFIGDIADEQLPRLSEALRSLKTGVPIPVCLRGFGWMPNPHSPRILCVRVVAHPLLDDLHKRTDEALAALGIPHEAKPFRPHLTLARIPAGASVVELRHAIVTSASIDLGSFDATEFGLFQSRLQPEGSVYEVRETFSV